MENKIISWNVNGINCQKKKNIIFNWIQKQKCNICCLQETHIRNKNKRLLIKKILEKNSVHYWTKEKEEQ